MAEFKYKAVSTSGVYFNGTYEAPERDSVITMIRDKRWIPISVEEIVKGQEISFGSSKKKKIKENVLAVFCRQMSSMLYAGMPIVTCLELLSEQTENKNMRSVLTEVYREVQTGVTLSDSLKNRGSIFPELMINLIEAGEVSGQVDNIMGRLATQYEKNVKLTKKVKGSMVYPMVLMVLAVCVVVFMLVAILPTFVSMFDSQTKIPVPTQIVMNLSNSLINYWYIYILVVVGIIFGIKKYLETPDGLLMCHSMALKIPMIKKIITKVITARFTRTLSTVLTSGIPLIHSMDIVASVAGNMVVTKKLQNAAEDIKRGDSLARAIKRADFFPPMVNSMLRIGEETGSVDAVMAKTADFYEDEVENAMQGLTTILEPVMLVFVAVCVGFIVVAMIMPMFAMFDNMKM